MMSKQSQKGGAESTNIQAGKMIVNVGIDERRAREIFDEKGVQLKMEYSREALEIANDRVEKFENKLMAKMEGALEAFADPSFQLLLVEAQKTAAATERPVDYDLLSELLLHRFKKGENRNTRAGINRAVEIVDEISDDSLLGLTVVHAVSSFLPVSGDINEGLNVLDNLFGKIMYGELPVGGDWIDHLDVLSAVRVSPLSQLKPLEEYYSEQLSGYVDVGIEKNSESHHEALSILESKKLSPTILVDSSFNPDFVRLNVPNKVSINSLAQRVQKDGSSEFFVEHLSKEQTEALISINDLYKRDNKMREKNIEAFKQDWDKKTNLKTLKQWWSGIEGSLEITSVGKVLAHSNAQRCDKNLPPLA